MTTTIAATKPTVRYHPIRGAVYGLFFGLGLALLLMVFKVLALSVPLIIVLGLVFLVLGGVLSPETDLGFWSALSVPYAIARVLLAVFAPRVMR